jgi:hypothetical protein
MLIFFNLLAIHHGKKIQEICLTLQLIAYPKAWWCGVPK